MLKTLCHRPVVIGLLLLPVCAVHAQTPGTPLGKPRRIVLPDSLLLTEIRSAAWGELGRIALLDGRARRVVVLDQQGRVERVFGRRGDAPGEFQYPNRVGFRHDTLWVVDRSVGRITFQDVRGRLWTASWRHPSPGPGLGAVSPMAVLSDGRIYGGPGVASNLPEGQMLTTSAIASYARPNSPIDTIFTSTFPVTGFTFALPAGGSVVTTNPFASPAFTIVSSNGRWIARLRERSSNGASRNLELRDMSAGGVRTVQVTCTAGQLTSKERARVVERFASLIAQPFGGVERARQAIEEKLRSVPPTRVCVHDMAVGTDGTVVLRMDDGETLSRWRVIRPGAGAPMELLLPQSARVLDARATELLLVETDEDGVPSLLIRNIP